MEKTLGGWAFVIGLIIAIVVAFVGTGGQAWPVYLLVILGLLVGLLNVTEREAATFLISAIAFLLTFGSLGQIAPSLPQVGEFFRLMGIFVAPAAAVVALKVLFVQTRD